MTQSQTCVDGGGTRWQIRSTWGKVYTDSRGARRVQNNVTSFTTASPAVKKVDYIIWTYDPDGTRIQALRRSNLRYDFRLGTASLTRDVRNPLSWAVAVLRFEVACAANLPHREIVVLLQFAYGVCFFRPEGLPDKLGNDEEWLWPVLSLAAQARDELLVSVFDPPGALGVG